MWFIFSRPSQPFFLSKLLVPMSDQLAFLFWVLTSLKICLFDHVIVRCQLPPVSFLITSRNPGPTLLSLLFSSVPSLLLSTAVLQNVLPTSSHCPSIVLLHCPMPTFSFFLSIISDLKLFPVASFFIFISFHLFFVFYCYCFPCLLSQSWFTH